PPVNALGTSAWRCSRALPSCFSIRSANRLALASRRLTSVRIADISDNGGRGRANDRKLDSDRLYWPAVVLARCSRSGRNGGLFQTRAIHFHMGDSPLIRNRIR